MNTIHDIAKELGISSSTVSRALSGKGYCSQSIKKKVMETAQKLNYAPQYAAKALKSKKTGKIMLVVPDICNPFYFDMINGINNVLEQHDYLLLLFHTKHSLKEELRAIQAFKEKYADGMILVSLNLCEENLNALESLSSPVILTNKYNLPEKYNNYDFVFIDAYLGIKMAVEHLLKQGHERIAYIGGNLKEQTGHERFIAYSDAISNAGFKVSKEIVFESNLSESEGYACGKELLKISPLPTAVVAANDLIAFGFMNACEEKGVRIPEDISLVGMDNTAIASRISPKLTSVAMMQEEVGRNAAEILMQRIQGDISDKKIIRIPPRLIVRESSVMKEIVSYK